MRCISACILLIFSTINLTIAEEEFPFDISFYGSYTASSKLFHHPYDAGESVRNQFFPLDNILSSGIDLRYLLFDDFLHLGLSVEYVSKIKSFTIPYGSSKEIPITDGYVAFPLELTGYSSIPTNSDHWLFYFGGGIGMYNGTRVYEKGNEKPDIIKSKLGLGIHILTSIQYRIFQNISFRSELKFRDIQFESTTKFAKSETYYEGEMIQLETEPSTARFNIDGMTLDIGIVLHL